MGAYSHSDEVRMKIQAFMEQVYRESRCSVFIPEQFVDEGMGGEVEVLSVLKELEHDGDLRGYATLRCAEGHDFFGGSPAEVAYCPLRECTYADCATHLADEQQADDDSNQPRVVVRYALSRRYLSVLDDPQKKTTQTHPS